MEYKNEYYEYILKAFSDIFYEQDLEEWIELNPAIYSRICTSIELYNIELLKINKDMTNKFIKLSRSIIEHSKDRDNLIWNDAIEESIEELLKLKK